LILSPVIGCARSILVTVLLSCAGLLPPNTLSAEPIAVRHTEGLLHVFLVLQTLEGQTIADGEETQIARGDRVTVHTIFRFKDGSIHDETTIFSQRGTFRLISDHLIQKGPSFKQSMDTVVDTSTSQVTVRYSDKEGKEKVLTEGLELQPDIANGLVLTLLKHIQPTVPQTTVSMVAATPKPRLIKLEIRPQGEDPFSVGSIHKKATHYVVKVQIGGVAGVVAPIIGKQPPDTHVWILGGGAPAFVKLEGALFEGGPIWRIKMANAAVFKAAPAKPQSSPAGQNHKK
jgi:hypothetical protein